MEDVLAGVYGFLGGFCASAVIDLLEIKSEKRKFDIECDLVAENEVLKSKIFGGD